MTFLEIVILILLAAFVSMIEIVVIMACVSHMIDAKAKAKISIMTNVWKNECEYIDKLFDKYMTRIEKMVDKATNKETPEPPRIGFGG